MSPRNLLTLALLFLSGCASTQGLQLNPQTRYRMDIQFQYNGVTYSGAAVLPKADQYPLRIFTPDRPQVVVLNTCHREVTLNPGVDKQDYVYVPTEIEKQNSCTLHISTFSQKVWYRGAMIDFSTDAFVVPAVVNCNGDSKKAWGVGVCQGKIGLKQELVFDRPMKAGLPEPACNTLTRSADSSKFFFNIAGGECEYKFSDDLGMQFKLTTFGYDDYLVQ